MKLFLGFFLSLYSFFGLAKINENTHWTPLLDTKLSHWEVYLSYRHQPGYTGDAPKNKKGKKLKPLGVLETPSDYGVYSVASDKMPILRVSGEIYGALTTKKAYRNYRLRLKFKWGDKVYPPREELLKDSGILYHAVGEHGKDYWRTWMVSQEFQIMRGHVGDYWSQGNSAIDIRAYTPEHIMNPVADVDQPYISVGAKQNIQGFVLRQEDLEKPEGQWNELELICFEGKSLHIVNGSVVMVLSNSRTVDASGNNIPLQEGRIQLQSEAAEIFYKDIFIREIEELPVEYSILF